MNELPFIHQWNINQLHTHLKEHALLRGALLPKGKTDRTSPVIAPVIGNVTQNSRQVNERSVFFAIAGANVDGHQFLKDVLARHPLAIVMAEEHVGFLGLASLDFANAQADGVALFWVRDSRLALATVLNALWDFPSRDLFCVGVTGTNGKTTTTQIIEFLLGQLAVPTAVMGTIDHHLGKKVWFTNHTTPGLEELYRRFAEFRLAGAQAVAMEITSHALDQRRAEGIALDVAVFTNFTRDHLDYHGSMEAYHAAKQLLFTRDLESSVKDPVFAVMNGDDPAVFATQVSPRADVLYFKISAPHSPGRELSCRVEQSDLSGLRLRIDLTAPDGQGHIFRFSSPLVGSFNVQNICAAVGVLDAYLRKNAPKNTTDSREWARQMGHATAQLKSFMGTRGRLERVLASRHYIFVDYAHTDDALRSVLTTLRREQIALGTHAGKLVVVFGCGGDRDRGKRPLMGAIAAELADTLFVTSDNPRTENPQSIVDEIFAGIPEAARARTVVEVDRHQAIAQAVRSLREHDILLVAGKGHETYQIIGTEKRHFDDREEILKNLEGLKPRA